MKTSEELDKELTRFQSTFGEVKTEIQKAIVGYDDRTATDPVASSDIIEIDVLRP